MGRPKKEQKEGFDREYAMKTDLRLREEAMKILEDHMSENTLKHIKSIDYLDQWIVDAMIEFHYKQIEKMVINTKKCICEAKLPFIGYDGRDYCRGCNEEIIK